MTYRFFCRFFTEKVAAWLTSIWFAIILITLFILSGFEESDFIYQNF